MATTYQSVFIPSMGAISATSIDVSGTAKANKFRGTSVGSAGDVTYGWDVPARNDNNEDGWYHDSADNNVRFAANGALIFVGSGSGVVAISTFTANNGATIDGGDLTMGTGRAVVLAAGAVGDCALQFTGDPNTGIYYTSADRYEMAANGGDTMSIRNQLAISYLSHSFGTIQGVAATTISVAAGHNLVWAGDGYIEMEEMAAPAAPAADRVRIYAVVDGGAKTDLAAIFQSGPAQVFAQEP